MLDQNWKTTLQGIGKKRGLLELWTATIGTSALEKHAAAGQKNRDAEDAYARRQLWDDNATVEGDDMTQTILGDVTNPTPIVVGGQQSSSLLPVVALLAGALIPGAGVAGYLLSAAAEKPEITQPIQDATVRLGLGKIEDYLDGDQ